MPIPPEFAAESLYTPDQWFIHDVLEIDRETGRVVGLLDTTRIGPMVTAQRPWAGHPQHVPGAVMIQMTSTLGNIHAVCVLGLKMTEGWVGFGAQIKNGRFGGLGRIGPPVIATMEISSVKRRGGTVFVEYRFDFQQEERRLYRSEQVAAWHSMPDS